MDKVAALTRMPARVRVALKLMSLDTRTVSDKQMDARLQFVLDYDDPQVLLDMKKGGARLDSTSFEDFWGIVRKVINGIGSAVHSRRADGVDHVAAVAANGDDSAPPNSLPDLYSTCVERAAQEPTDIGVPSLPWFLMQFASKTPTANRAILRTGRFNIKWAIQGHHLRSDHEDRHFGAKYYKFLREMAVQLRDIAIFICQDDKKKIAVGEPNMPESGWGE